MKKILGNMKSRCRFADKKLNYLKQRKNVSSNHPRIRNSSEGV